MDIKSLSYSFFGSFNSTHVLLYVGQSSNNDDLRKYIAKCPWSCVITGRRDPELALLFSEHPPHAQGPAQERRFLPRRAFPVPQSIQAPPSSVRAADPIRLRPLSVHFSSPAHPKSDYVLFLKTQDNFPH